MAAVSGESSSDESLRLDDSRISTPSSESEEELQPQYEIPQHERGRSIVVKPPGFAKPVLRFQPVSENKPLKNEDIPKGQMRLAFKIMKTESKLIRSTCSQHGMKEVHPSSSEFNIMWAGTGIKPHDVSGG